MPEYSPLQAVEKGAQFLDGHTQNWLLRVNTKTLNMASDSKGVLGQLFGGYREGTCALDLSPAQAIENGFIPPLDAVAWDYEFLTHAWIAVIVARLSAPAPASENTT